MKYLIYGGTAVLCVYAAVCLVRHIRAQIRGTCCGECSGCPNHCWGKKFSNFSKK